MINYFFFALRGGVTALLDLNISRAKLFVATIEANKEVQLYLFK
jgi:hypothetical protein